MGQFVTVDQAAVTERVGRVLPLFPEVAAAYLFGSALGACRQDSDLDLALIVKPEVERNPEFSPWGLEGRCAAALGWLAGHCFHPTVLARESAVFAMQAFKGRLVYCVDEAVVADYIEGIARAFPDANRRWLQALNDVLSLDHA